jgi:hypothetical protein
MSEPQPDKPSRDDADDDFEDDLDDEFDDDFDDEAEDIPPSKPADSKIIIERFPDGLTIQIPPAGLWRGTHGLFLMSLIWNGFMLVITTVMIGVLLDGNANKDKPGWALFAFLSLFWLAGIGIFLGALNMGRRRAAIAVTGGTLMIIQTGIFGSKQREWPPGDVGAIRTGPSGMTVNDRPVLELQIFGGGASKFGLLAGRRDDELYWLAYELRVVLALAERM